MIRAKKQREAALAVVIVLAEKVEIEHKAEHEDTYVQHLPGQHQPLLADGFTALDGFFTQAFEDVVGLLVDYLAPVDDFLPAQDDAVGP